MFLLHKDLIYYIGQYLSNKEKIYLSMTSSSHNLLKYNFVYDDSIDAKLVAHLSYYDNFTFIKTTRLDKLFPKNIKHLHLTMGSNICDPIKNPIPASVTNLTLVLSDTLPENTVRTNEMIADYITNSVTHFTLHMNTGYIKRILNDTPIEFTCLRKNNPKIFVSYPDSVISITTYLCC